MASVIIGDGSTSLFWSDVWHGVPFNVQWPHLFSFVKDANTSVQNFLDADDKSEFFHVPLSIEAHDQYQQMITELQNIQPSHNKDVWNYIWGSSLFTSNKA